jgi:hypothetical protein
MLPLGAVPVSVASHKSRVAETLPLAACMNIACVTTSAPVGLSGSCGLTGVSSLQLGASVIDLGSTTRIATHTVRKVGRVARNERLASRILRNSCTVASAWLRHFSYTTLIPVPLDCFCPIHDLLDRRGGNPLPMSRLPPVAHDRGLVRVQTWIRSHSVHGERIHPIRTLGHGSPSTLHSPIELAHRTANSDSMGHGAVIINGANS